MVFSSATFAFFFLPLFLLVYHLLFLPVSRGARPRWFRRAANFWLLGCSLFFYFWGETFLIWIVIASTLIDYFCGLLISGGLTAGGPVEALTPGGGRSRRQKLGLLLSITTNLGLLFTFKYFNFALDSYRAVAESLGLGGPGHDLASIALPLGISFYTFQSMSYTIDVYRGRVAATRSLVDFACFVTMFPQLVAGPIVRYREVAEQLVRRTVSRPLFVEGIHRFLVGMAKKILVADVVAMAADAAFAVPRGELAPGLAWVGLAAYTLQIYYDFSGYSDMAVGLGKMLGFRLPENFRHPYAAASVRDFWRRWHISLSTWFRDYLYIPLGGNRGSAQRTYVNLITVFFLCGLWHGAAWSFVVWGLFHGLFLVAERWGLGNALAKLPRPVGHLYTLAVVMGSWVFFRAPSLGGAMGYFASLFGLTTADPLLHPLGQHLTGDVLLALVVGAVMALPVMPAVERWWRRQLLRPSLPRLTAAAHSLLPLATHAALALAIAVRLAAATYNPFIYFRF